MSYARSYRGALLLGVLAAVVHAVGAAGYTYLVGPLLKTLLAGPNDTVGLIPLSRLPLVLITVAAVKGLAGLAYASLMSSVGQRTVEALRQDVYAHLLRQPPRFFAERHTGELFSRLLNDVGQVEFSVSLAFGSYVKDSLQILALLVVCAALDLRLFVLAFVVMPLAVLPIGQFARRAKRAAQGTQTAMGELTALMAEQLHNLPVVQAFRSQPRALARYDFQEQTYLTGMRRSLQVRGAFTPALELLGMIGLALALSFGARQVALEPLLAEKILSFFAAVLLIYPALRSLSTTLTQSVQGRSAAERLFELRDAPLPPERTHRAGPLHEGVVFDNVWVHYPDGRTGLQGASFELRAGQQVALVGPSGAGKSTAVALLLGLVEPSRGRVVWDGLSLDEVQRASLRAQIGWVPQEPTLFSGTVRGNLLLAKPEASESELWEALRLSYAETFVRALPLGLDQPVGERGSQLSGGQRQRLAVARAFLRAPSLLLLDEPTRALDPLSEREVTAGLDALRHGRTALIVAHRLGTVEQADWVVVLDQGRVAEQGTHAGLSTREGRYRRMLQAAEREAPGPPVERIPEARVNSCVVETQPSLVYLPRSPLLALGQWLFQFRSFTPVPVLLALAYLFARSRGIPGPGGAGLDEVLNLVGLGVAFLGQALRFYTLGQVPEGTSGQGSALEAVTLNRRGPYAYVRNPLYLGNLGICLGLLLIANCGWAYLLGLAFFFGEYFFIIRAEESFLRGRFGAEFDAFVQEVPRWIPRLTPAVSGALRTGFDVRRALKKEHNPFAAWALGAIGLLFWEGAARGTLGTTGRWALAVATGAVVALFAAVKSYKRGLWGQA
jgi:subfamily B ATP-binding cassette protein MsbA